MKKLFFPIVIALGSSFLANAQNVVFKDANFKAKLVKDLTINTNNDSEIQLSEALATNELLIYGAGIKDLTGLEAFVNVLHIRCDNNQFKTIDLSKLKSLRDFRCGENFFLESLDFSHNTELTKIDFNITNISSIDLSKNTKLTWLECSGTKLNSLDLSKNVLLKYLYISDLPITTIDLTANTALETLYMTDSQINLLYLVSNIKLKNLYTVRSKLLFKICLSSTRGLTSGIDSTTYFSFKCNIPTGIEEVMQTETALVYPNPSQNTLYVHDNVSRISLYNTSGNLIFASESKQMDVSHLECGIYFALLTKEDGSIFHQKIVKK